MPFEDVNMLWLAIDSLEAQETLIAFKVSAYPHMKDADRQELHKRIYTIAYPSREKRVLSTEELRARLTNV